jgi:hypothetical protein
VRREELDLGNLRLLLRGDPGSGFWLPLLLLWLLSLDLVESEEVDFLRADRDGAGEALSRALGLSLSLLLVLLLGVLVFLSALEKSGI